MKILWLNAGLLLPLDKGGKLRTWHVMRHLAARHDIHYLSFEDATQTEADRRGNQEPARRPIGQTQCRTELRQALPKRPHRAGIQHRRADYVAAPELGEK